jgi:hypothetical protein
MSRVRLSPQLLSALLLSLAACGAPDPAPAAGDARAVETAYPVAAPPAMMPDDAPPQEEAPAEVDDPAMPGPATCRSAIGETASALLVQRCIAVSPATRPPCHDQNPCALIQDEIDRACGQYGDDRPAECAA